LSEFWETLKEHAPELSIVAIKVYMGSWVVIRLLKFYQIYMLTKEGQFDEVDQLWEEVISLKLQGGKNR
jgi:hypothetical protein